MASFLVTGASRGLGLALVSRLVTMPLAEVGTIIATARSDNSPRLDEIAKTSSGRVEIVKLDVSDQRSAQEAAREVERQLQGKGLKGLDYLINNAGTMDYNPKGLEGMYVYLSISSDDSANTKANRDNLNEIFNTNVTSSHMVTQAFLPLLRNGEKKVVVNM